MSGRRHELLVTGETYHVYNQSVGNETIFLGKREYKRALELIDYYRFPQTLSFSKFKTLPYPSSESYLTAFKKTKPIVEIFAFALMPNHFHFLLTQLSENGIRKYLSNLQNGYAKYFDKKYERPGSLFQKPFKAKRVEKDEYVLHLSRYIHLNPVTAYIIDYEDLNSYPWTSYQYYLKENKQDIVDTEFILKIVRARQEYEKFVKDRVNYQRELHKIKGYLFD